MTFYIGQKKAGEIFLGGKKIGRIYLGQTLVHMTAVVSKPTFLEYIETDGNSYIDTGYLPSENTYVEYTFEIISKPTGSFNGLFGSRLDTSRYPYNVFCKNYLQLRIDYGRYTETSYQCALNTKYTMRAGNNKVYINDELVKSYVVGSPGTSPYSMYLGNFNAAGTPYATGTAQKIYGWKVYENNVLSQDLHPALDPSGKVCMYDTVSGKYFYNAGTGELKAGGRFVESIVFDGNSYIDTEYLPNEQTYVEYTFEVYNATNYQGLFGSRKDQTEEGYVFDVFIRNANYLRIDWGAHIGNEFTNYSLNTKYTMKAGLGEVYLDDTLVKTYTVPATGTSPYSIYLGNINDAGKPYASGSLQKVYGFKAYENNALIQDLRPYVDSDGVACFKDVVTDTLFYNKGTGTLTYTE